MSKAALEQPGEALLGDSMEVMELTGVLGPDTPLSQLPEVFVRNTPKIKTHKLSGYDEDGPFFAWEWLKLGEHSDTWCIGTKFGQVGEMGPHYPANHLLNRDNCFGLASLANLDRLSLMGAILIAAPLKNANGAGSPISAMALVGRA